MPVNTPFDPSQRNFSCNISTGMWKGDLINVKYT